MILCSNPECQTTAGCQCNSQDATVIEIAGITHELDGGRSVFVGQVPGESKVYLKFWNGEFDTKIGLSFEASVALRDLLGSISTRGLMASSSWVLVSEDRGDATPSDAALAT